MKNKLVLIFLILAAAIVGGILGELTVGMYGLSWLSYGKTIGFDTISLDIIFMDLTFGLHFSLNVAQVILLMIALLVHKKVSSLIDV